MKIDFANLKLAYQEHKESFDLAINKIVSSASYIMGAEIDTLEKNLSEFTGAPYALSCSSGTDALLLAMMAIDIKPGDEIITTPFTFIATAETIAFLGAKPVFVDIEEATYNINPSLIESKITSKTKAIIPVSIFGQTSNMDKINEIASRNNLYVIEDAAQSFGAVYNKKRSCNLSHIGCTSFFPAKPLGCFGDGGAIFTQNKELSDKINSLRLHGQTQRYYHKYIGMGGRLDTIQAAILNVKLKYYEVDIKKRQEVALKYTEKLKSSNLILPKVMKDRTSVWAQYSVRVKNRSEVQNRLKEKGIPTAVHYPMPLHLQECFKYLGYKNGDFAISETVSNEILSLPMNPYLTEKEINYITTELKTILK
ncbi:DegT/DnrJ/EryC1/StrS aminotransferase family protein [Mesoflavibacter zeaxanthinifaciens]|uniref:DegT/DnrJ/EryC1/StrS family aminotransferase n=1 Tax=Mesoflavibacter zeaxanthinifaciens TaxID=393060 RepID=UPI0026F2EA44|nr:DegT/DnrJ/EryC1/StrS family aminotransferase [Mesoflavibacter zeaxanthinifaciens]